MWQGTLGMFGYGRALGDQVVCRLGAGNLLVAGEGTAYDGPWDVPDRMNKFNGVVRYSQGTALDGFSITGMAYNNRWTSTDQVAAARDRPGPDRPLRHARSDRRRPFQPLQPVEPIAAR